MASSSTTPSDATNGNGAAYIPTYAELFPSLAVAPTVSRSAVVGAVRSSNVTQSFSVPVEEQRYRDLQEGGFGGSKDGSRQTRICQEIMEKTDVHLEVSLSRDRTLTVLINGKRDSVSQAKKLLLAKLQTQANADLVVPPEHLKFIVGKGGAILKQLCDDTACQITVPKGSVAGEPIHVMGTAENVRKAVEAMRAISDEKQKFDEVKMPVLKAYHALIAGWGNNTIKRIEEETGARVLIPPPPKNVDEIVVRGEKPGVGNAVQRINEIYEEKKRTCGELTAQVKRTQHRFIIGPKGVNLQEILKKTGCVVEVPGPNDDNETITLRGPQANLVHALTSVYEKANSQVSEEIQVPGWLHRHVIGKGGENVKLIATKYPKVHVQFQTDDNLVEIEGPPEEVAAARAAILTLSNDLQASLSFADLKVDPQYHRHLIGKGGSTITKIKNDTGAQINMPASDSNGDIVRIEGRTESVKAAKAAVEALVKELENTSSIDMIIEQRLHSQLIGSGGAGIKELITKFNGININFPNSKENSEVVTLRGDRKDVQDAEKYIKQLVVKLRASNFQIIVPVFKQFHRNIIGKGGANIKEIKDATNCRINIPNEGDASDGIAVIGLEKDCEKAKAMILKIQDQFASIVTEVVEIDAKHHNTIIGPKGRVVNSVSAECGNVQIHFPKEKEKSNKVEIRGPKEDVAAAKAKLTELAAEAVTMGHTIELQVNRDHHKHIIGRGGAAAQAIQAETKARIIFPTAKDTEDDIITIIGKEANCKAAAAAIKKRVTELESVVEETTTVDPKWHAFFIARRAQTLRDLADQYGGVVVNFPKKGSGSDVVTLKGGKEDVKAAIARIAQLADDAANQTTMECQIPAQYHAAVAGRGGANIQNLTRDHNVQITLPKRALPGRANGAGPAAAAAAPAAAVVSAEGDDGEPAAAAAATTDDAAAPATTDDAAAPADDAAAPADAAPAAAAEPAVNKADTIVVSGRTENCEAAIAAMQALVPTEEMVDIPADYHRFIIGSKGEAIREFMVRYDVWVKFPSNSSGGDQVLVRGLADKLEAAKKQLAVKVAELDADKEDREARSFKVEINVDPAHHSTLIGPKGANIGKIRDEFGVQIDFPRRNNANSDSSDVITVTGYQDKAEAAAAALQEQADALAEQITIDVDIHPSIHGKVIGFKGANVKALQEKHNVRINFPREKDSGLISVSGMPDDVDAVEEELLLIQEEFEEDIREKESEQQYLRPPSKVEGAPAKQQAFPKMSGTPWSAGQLADSKAFPGLGNGAAAPSKAAGGAWGKK